jgi:hypothetical protein
MYGAYTVFNVGTDKTIVVTNLSTGANVLLGGRVTEIQSASKDQLITSQPIDNGGRVDHRVLPEGWSGTLTVDRANGDADNLKAMLDAAFYAGQGQVFFSILETITNQSDGTTNQFQYTNVVLHEFDGGAWRKDKVPTKIQFAAQERLAVGF